MLQHGAPIRDRFDDTIVVKPDLNLKFEPERWNSPDLLKSTNCYAYALNNPQVGMGQLGGLATKIESWLGFDKTGDEWFIRKMAEQDGLIPISESQLDPGQHHIIGVFTGEMVEWGEVSFDYHFIRKDSDGNWSHKPGLCPVAQLLIPPGQLASEALLAEYRKDKARSFFMGFFEVPRDGVIAVIDQKIKLPEQKG